MVTANEIKQEIYKTIDVIIAQRLKETAFIEWYEGVIKQYNKKNNTYEVESNNATLSCYVINNDTYSIGDVVRVLKFKTDRIILTKKNASVI